MAFSLPRPPRGPEWFPAFISALEDILNRLDRTNTVTITSSQTLQRGRGTVLVDATGGAVTVTLPTASTAKGVFFDIKKIDASGNAVTIDGAGSETIDGAATKSTTTRWDSWTVKSNGTAWFIL